jgi:hypothetical protein
MKFHAQKQIGKSHMIDIFTSEDMEVISLCIFQYLTLYYAIQSSTVCWLAMFDNTYRDIDHSGYHKNQIQ